MYNSDSYLLGFQNQVEELQNVELSFKGKLPSWLQGSYIINGGGQTSFKEAKYNHWFDGLSMLKKFEISGEKISYSNKFLKTKDYLNNTTQDKINYTAFGTNSSNLPFYLWEKILAMAGIILSDNTNVSIQKFGDDYVALTELLKAVRFDPKDLSTFGSYPFLDKLSMAFSTAHPHFDYERGKIYNAGVKIGLPSKYIIYEIDPKTKKRQVISSITCSAPSYAHSFAMTKDYIIFAEYSMKMNPLDLLTSLKPISHTLYFDNKNPVKFHIIDKNNGKVVRIFETKPNFAFHHANAFQVGSEIILDSITSSNKNIFQDLTLENIAKTDLFRGKIRTNFERFHLSLHDGSVKSQIMTEESFEFPSFNYQIFNSKPYRYCFGTGFKDAKNSLFWDSLLKIDLETNQVSKWQENNCFVGEPVFVPNPELKTEDQGVILSVILDANQEKSYLLVLDAQTFQELARAYVPHIIPYSFHGQFFK